MSHAPLRLLLGFAVGMTCLSVFLLHPAASEEEEVPTCYGEAELRQNPPPEEAIVKGAKGTRLYFYGQELQAKCLTNPAQCRQSAYLIPQDRVVVYKRHQNWACSQYIPTKSNKTTFGWLPAKELETVSAKPLPTNEWGGVWKNSDFPNLPGQICLSPSSDSHLKAVADAYYSHFTGVNQCVHTGNFEGPLQLKGNAAFFKSEDCNVNFYLLNNKLIVHDLGYCGGANVSFTGLYQKVNQPCTAAR